MSIYAERLRKQIEGDEGRERCAYQDHLGYWTIGIGRLIDKRKPGAGLRDNEIELMFENDVQDRELELSRKIPFFMSLNPPRRAAVLNMSFQLGVAGLLGFPKMLAAIRDERWAEAETHALDSKWAKVDTPARAKRVARQIRTGEWEY